MKLAILSCSPHAYSTRRLKEAAEQRGHQAKVLNTLKIAIDLDRGSPDLYYRKNPLAPTTPYCPELGLRVAGVDMLEGKDGSQVMEVNSSPGLEGIETCTDLDIAGSIVDYIAAQVDFPEIDVRQRLTVSKGYGVSEIYIPEGSRFIGQTVKGTKLSENDVNVLTLYRGAKVIPNPRGDRILEPGDKLLCFGKLEAMRGMNPARTRRKRLPVVQELDTAIAIGEEPST